MLSAIASGARKTTPPGASGSPQTTPAAASGGPQTIPREKLPLTEYR